MASFVISGVISASDNNQQVLDRLQVEKERGITVKAQTVSLFYTHKGTKYLLNLIDTPVSNTILICYYWDKRRFLTHYQTTKF